MNNGRGRDTSNDHEIAESAFRLVDSIRPYSPVDAAESFTVTVGLEEWKAFRSLVRGESHGT